jgi:hypothetical protein
MLPCTDYILKRTIVASQELHAMNFSHMETSGIEPKLTLFNMLFTKHSPNFLSFLII